MAWEKRVRIGFDNMIPAGRIAAIWRYPVKSMAGERITAAQVDERGVHADRTWAVRDVELNTTTGAKRLPGLLLCTARYAHEPTAEAGPGNAPDVVIGFPDGTEVSSADPAVHRILSDFVGRDVELQALPALSDRDLYRGTMATKADLRSMFGLGPDEPLPDLSMFPVRKLAELSRYATPVGSFVDAYPVHILSEQALQAMGALAPGSDFDVRRFRPTMLVDCPGSSPHPELDWCGGELDTPHATFSPLIPTIRCVMPSLEQAGLAGDPVVTRTVAAHSRRCLGVYATVAKPGRISEGELELDPPNRSAVASVASATAGRMKRAVMQAASLVLPSSRR